ncbi:hypothetical protein SERLADRAFT_373663 [Serpula lacrymans var. lacrymans S7.9]|uniref:Uncharacterized protein n=1 Tax=Serpula lacrymans var. lacrymans (strain S7.9) TaxID=578457 RepID=F8P9B6_SERL9|nr:uncharacterized protein SERLADRAFT_373663 [Serpula lacrymans var. lacrymans S7.9]EGO20245.1 hypothetical protein SERLADRAFT_373663 [Serpula lacrymans var. lacrymans S7.9]
MTQALRTGNDILDVTARRSSQPVPRKPSNKKDIDEIKVGQWILLVNRLDVISHRCSHIEAEAARLSFSREWGHEEVDTYLRAIFPTPFGYIDNHTKGKSINAAWVLIEKENRRIAIVPKDRPSGQDLYRYRGPEKCSVANARIMIGMFL